MIDFKGRMMEKVPVDDISLLYGKAPDELKIAVTNLLISTSHLCLTVGCDSDIALNWRANPSESIHMLLGIAATGKGEFGRLWLEELKSQMNQLS